MFTGEHLKEFRRRYALTQREVAAYVRVLPREVKRWEQGVVQMPLHRRLLLARLMWDKTRQQRRVPMDLCPQCCGCGLVPKARPQ